MATGQQITQCSKILLSIVDTYWEYKWYISNSYCSVQPSMWLSDSSHLSLFIFSACTLSDERMHLLEYGIRGTSPNSRDSFRRNIQLQWMEFQNECFPVMIFCLHIGSQISQIVSDALEIGVSDALEMLYWIWCILLARYTPLATNRIGEMSQDLCCGFGRLIRSMNCLDNVFSTIVNRIMQKIDTQTFCKRRTK